MTKPVGLSEASVRTAEKVVATAQRAFDAEPSVETAMLLDAARRKLFLKRREAAGQESARWRSGDA